MEIEAKVRLKNPAKVRASLKSSGATFVGRVLEKNWLYDHSDRILTRADKLLRVRKDQRNVLTFKGPRQQSDYKKREEVQIEFPDASLAKSLLEAVGFTNWFYYEKIRETWRLGSCEVVLDELPQIGLFVEVEGPGGQEIEDALKKLKLNRELISSSYVELLRDLSAQKDTRATDFRFPPGYEPALGTPESAHG